MPFADVCLIDIDGDAQTYACSSRVNYEHIDFDRPMFVDIAFQSSMALDINIVNGIVLAKLGLEK